ncbi:hypothetical protein HWV62_26859 [Athelia sp. TMB]|nr:hypothetical protein HWV62_26859 [Athelia sp. TMB]
MTVIQRPLRGSRISSFYPVKSLPALSSLDSAFQLQEYISLLIRLDVHDVDTIVSVPGKQTEKTDNSADELKGEEAEKEKEKEKEKDRKSDVAVDEACWIYEQLSNAARLTTFCTRLTAQLRSSTLPEPFPPARRLGRIFAHAYFHHREAFEQAEAESSLYARFLALTSKFELVPAEFLVIPTPSQGEGRGRDIEVQPPRLLGASVGLRNQVNEQDAGNTASVDMEGHAGATDWDGKGNERGKSPPGLSGPGPARGNEHSPRRYGRSRTDTMVFSEAFSVAEELAKEHQEREVDPPAPHQPEEIAIESADITTAPEHLSLPTAEDLEAISDAPAITVSSPEAPSFEQVPTAEETFAPEDAPISATEIEPAPAPSAALAEELTASPFEPTPDVAVADEAQPEAPTETAPVEEHEKSESAEAEHIEHAPHASESPEAVATAPPAITEEPKTDVEEAKEPEAIIEDPVPEPIKEHDFAVPVPTDAAASETPGPTPSTSAHEAPAHEALELTPETVAPAEAEPAEKETAGVATEIEPTTTSSESEESAPLAEKAPEAPAVEEAAEEAKPSPPEEPAEAAVVDPTEEKD